MTKEFVFVYIRKEMIHAYDGMIFDDMMEVIKERIKSFFKVVWMVEIKYNDRVSEIYMRLWEWFR
jgi:hypothetical protein